MFGPSPEATPQKAEPEPSAQVDTVAVARMKASMSTPPVAPKPVSNWEPRQRVPKPLAEALDAAPESPQPPSARREEVEPEPAPSSDTLTSDGDEERENLEFDFNEEF